MVIKSRLEVGDLDLTASPVRYPYNLGFKKLLPISINYSVADIRNPEGRDSTYSKTIVVPSTKEANEFFEFIFDVNIETNSFNANLKTSARYYVNEVKIFEGSIQLLKINKKVQDRVLEVEYECSLIGRDKNLFMDIYNKYLTDIDLSSFNHTLTYSSGLVNPSIGTDEYCYPFIDYGLSGGNSYNWYWADLKPAVFEWYYIQRIFEDAGYRTSSNYLGSTYAQSIIIPDVNAGALQLEQTDVDNAEIYVGRLTTHTTNTAGVSGIPWSFTMIGFAVPFNNDSTSPFRDIGANYNTGTFEFTTPIAAYYNHDAACNCEIVINPPATTTSLSGQFTVYTVLQQYISSVWTNILVTSSVVNVSAATGNTFSTICNHPGAAFAAGEKFRYAISAIGSVTFLNGVSPITSGTSSIDFLLKSGTTWHSYIYDPRVAYGSTVYMNNTIPKDIRQVDFLTSIIKCENLYFEQQSDGVTYKIEPRDSFYDFTSDPLDWTSKLDTSKEIEVLPMGDLDFNKLVFDFKADEDYYNKIYQEEFKEVYGHEEVETDNQFIKNEKKIEVIFSPTPVARYGNQGIVAPRFFTKDNGVVQPIECNIRRLYFGGLKSGTHNLFQQQGSAAVAVYSSTYPFAGMINDPVNPTLDLGFGIPNRLYWNFGGQTYTNNNRYNARYSKFVSEITDRDSKLVVAYFNLNELDIHQLSFRSVIFVDGTYYLLNKILDYDPQQTRPTKVELFKSITSPDFTPADVEVGGGQNRIANTNETSNGQGNYGNAIGTNNINLGENSLIIGDNNIIGFNQSGS